MITVDEATKIILDNLFNPGTELVPVHASAGRILAEEICTDRDFPPFDRVSMDGIAIRFEAWGGGQRRFRVEAMQVAGESRKKLNDATHCIEVMTGAVLPDGCDAVVRYEDVDIVDGEAAIKTDTVVEWQSIHRQGMDAHKDEIILQPGQKVAPSEVALLASVGKSMVRVRSFPGVAIISTGDELVDIDETPHPWQIRRSNSYSLQAALREMGVDAHCFHLKDEKSTLEQGLCDILRNCDVLILSGGVSKGKLDFVPDVLQSIGISKLFHEVSQRPGKPFWFGKSSEGKTAFALPGNPVSTFMCFYRYVKPWISKSMGVNPIRRTAILGKDFSFGPPITYFLQVSVKDEGGRNVAYPVPGGGSGDFANLKNVDGFLELPLERSDFSAGEVFPYISFRH